MADRCSDCLMHLSDCFCGFFSQSPCAVALDVYIHYRDIRKPSNTGRLADLCVSSARVHVHGEKGRPTPAPNLGPGSVLLFPGPKAVFLDQAIQERKVLDQSPIDHLIVVDGNWSQAGRMARRIGGLVGIPSVTLPPGPPSRYFLRREPINRPEGLATAEAMSRALAHLGQEAASSGLLNAFNVMVERTLKTRGRRSLLPQPC